MGKVSFRDDYDPPVFRKVAFATWKTASDPSVYAQVDIDMTQAIPFMEKLSADNGVKVTPTHLVAKAITRCMVSRPEINGMIRGGKISLRKHVALFFQVNAPGAGEDKVKGASLSGTTVHQIEDYSTVDIARRLSKNASDIKQGKDASFNQSMQMIRALPWCLVRPFLLFSMWLIYGLNLNLSFLGFPKDPFGSAMITNIGGMGLDIAWAPLCPYTRVPLLLTIGAIRDRVVAIDGKPEVRKIMSIGVTFDHRLIDGVHAAQMCKEFTKCFAEPQTYLV
jgi:pyruvate dehydrogenase E2 component (dihydrolipoamide acetyltransferase)